jgi:glycine cleavage system H protein
MRLLSGAVHKTDWEIQQNLEKEDRTMQIDRFSFPDDLLYDKEHNWARIEGDVATIGLTDFGQDLAGEIVYAEVPRVGREITQGEPFMSLESGKWVGRIKAIVSGTIAEANEEIEWESTIINEDPYGEGWFARVDISGEPQGLMKAADPEYADFVAAEREKYGK